MTMDLSEIKILFFDIGNVFVSDDPSGCYGYRSLYEHLASEGVQMAVDQFFAKRTEHVRAGGNLWTFVAAHVPRHEFTEFQTRVRAEMYSRWPEMSPEVPEMRKAAEELSSHYRLGIIANQPREVRALLDERRLLPLFEVVAISDELELEKPEHGIFEWALAEAQVRPEEAMMIGDRIDNDIKPAKALQMRTLWLRLGHEGRGWEPKDEFEQCYAWSLGEVNFSEVEPKTPQEAPDLIARSAEELVQLLKQP
ncbi:MAG: HAD family hydrolase [Candidatus Sumerlaeaceae bacterium]